MRDGTIEIVNKETSVRLLSGEAAIVPFKTQVDAFRTKCARGYEIMTSLDYFLPLTKVRGARPVLVMIFRRDTLFGIALFYLRREHGIPLGIARAGDGAGGGGVIGDPENWTEVLEIASEVLFKVFAIHTVFISVLWQGDIELSQDWSARRAQTGWRFRVGNNRLDLTGGYEATMSRIGYKMRRNLRYYRKRAMAEFGCRFVSELSNEDRQKAVAALYNKVIFAYSARQALDYEDFLASRAGHFAMGLQDAEGHWISYVAGWRVGTSTCVEWQLNDNRFAKYSLSTVMRSFLIEFEAERQASDIIFVGGTSEIWSRVCEPGMCGELLATRAGLIGALTRRLTILVRPQGKLAQLHRAAIGLTADAGK